MAQRVRPTRDEFEVTENEVIHMPTGATWMANPGDPMPKFFREAKLGSVLPNGDDYRPHEVREMAEQLLKERLEKE